MSLNHLLASLVIFFCLVERERKGDIITNSVKIDPRANFFGDDNGNGRSLGFDMGTFMSEVQRLKLANQQMSITVHTIEGSDEPTLYLGLASCRRYRTDISSDSEVKKVLNHNVSHYYSADCVWRHLQHSENVDHSAASGVGDLDNDGDLPDTQHLVSQTVGLASFSCELSNRLCFILQIYVRLCSCYRLIRCLPSTWTAKKTMNCTNQ